MDNRDPRVMITNNTTVELHTLFNHDAEDEHNVPSHTEREIHYSSCLREEILQSFSRSDVLLDLDKISGSGAVYGLPMELYRRVMMEMDPGTIRDTLREFPELCPLFVVVTNHPGLDVFFDVEGLRVFGMESILEGRQRLPKALIKLVELDYYRQIENWFSRNEHLDKLESVFQRGDTIVLTPEDTYRDDHAHVVAFLEDKGLKTHKYLPTFEEPSLYKTFQFPPGVSPSLVMTLINDSEEPQYLTLTQVSAIEGIQKLILFFQDEGSTTQITGLNLSNELDLLEINYYGSTPIFHDNVIRGNINHGAQFIFRRMDHTAERAQTYQLVNTEDPRSIDPKSFSFLTRFDTLTFEGVHDDIITHKVSHICTTETLTWIKTAQMLHTEKADHVIVGSRLVKFYYTTHSKDTRFPKFRASSLGELRIRAHASGLTGLDALFGYTKGVQALMSCLLDFRGITGVQKLDFITTQAIISGNIKELQLLGPVSLDMGALLSASKDESFRCIKRLEMDLSYNYEPNMVKKGVLNVSAFTRLLPKVGQLRLRHSKPIVGHNGSIVHTLLVSEKVEELSETFRTLIVDNTISEVKFRDTCLKKDIDASCWQEWRKEADFHHWRTDKPFKWDRDDPSSSTAFAPGTDTLKYDQIVEFIHQKKYSNAVLRQAAKRLAKPENLEDVFELLLDHVHLGEEGSG